MLLNGGTGWRVRSVVLLLTKGEVLLLFSSAARVDFYEHSGHPDRHRRAPVVLTLLGIFAVVAKVVVFFLPLFLFLDAVSTFD
jgi:hypothetical protein